MFVYVPPRCRFTVLLYTVAFISHVHARIRPNDDELTVYPNACDTNSDADGNRQRNGFVQVDKSGNCGILRLDAEENSWLLSSKDGVYMNIPSTVSDENRTGSVRHERKEHLYFGILQTCAFYFIHDSQL